MGSGEEYINEHLQRTSQSCLWAGSDAQLWVLCLRMRKQRPTSSKFPFLDSELSQSSDFLPPSHAGSLKLSGPFQVFTFVWGSAGVGGCKPGETESQCPACLPSQVYSAPQYPFLLLSLLGPPQAGFHPWRMEEQLGISLHLKSLVSVT